MSVHITKTYNIGGLTGLRQKSVIDAGLQLGHKEMSLFRFLDQYDSDEELDVRMDGIISALCPDDIVIFQYPSGCSSRYDNCLIKHIRMYAGIRLVIWVQESASLREKADYTMDKEIDFLSKGDLLVFSSDGIRKLYSDDLVLSKPYLLQNVSDIVTDISASGSGKKIYILAEENSGYNFESEQLEIIAYDEYHVPEMFMKMSGGGIGLIWDEDTMALAMFMAAGIPVIVKRGLSCESYVKNNQIGFVVSDFNDVCEIIEKSDEGLIDLYRKNVMKLRKIFTKGLYTKRLLMDIEIGLEEK